MNGSKRILVITSEFPPGPGGIGNHAYNLAKHFKLNNIAVKVLAVSDFADKFAENKFDKAQSFEIVRFRRFSGRLKTYWRRIVAILHAVKKEDYTHIIFSGRFSLIASLFLKRTQAKIKFIAIAHGGDISIDNFVEKILVNRALLRMDLIIPVSNFSKSKLSLNINRKRINVIPNGIDFDNIEGITIIDKEFQNGYLNLVSVGTVWPRKGHHNVFNALPEIISDYPEVNYDIIGKLADLSRIKIFLEDEAFMKRLRVHGLISNEKMYKILLQSQIFILLSEAQSSGDFEGFGIAILEANYFGLPAIGSKNCGIEDSINNGFSGILVDPHSPKEIKEAVKKIMNNYSKFSEGARTWSMQHHWSKIILRYIEAINSIN